MRNFIGDSIADLISDLKENITTFVHQEVELAKKEMSEKLSTYVRNGVKVAVGGFVAYAGLIVFLAGIGLIIGFGFESLGLDPVLALFIGLVIVGLLAGSIGGLMALQGIKAISATSPVPEKAINTVKQVSGADRLGISKPPRVEDSRSSDELQKATAGTVEHLQENKEELAFKLSPRQLKDRAMHNMKEHPVIWGVAALGSAATMATGIALLGRKFLTRRGIKALNLLPNGGKRIFKRGKLRRRWTGLAFT